MTELSLRQFLQREEADPTKGVRSCCAPGMRNRSISLRSLMSGLRIIHISDLHFSDSKYYLNTGGSLGIQIQEQDSAKRSEILANYLIQNRILFGTNKIVITGDITDSGDDGDYKIFAKPFIQRLRDNNFEVYSVPGNHDYCKMGVIIVNDKLKDVYCSLCPLQHWPPLIGSCLRGKNGHLAPPGAECPIDVFEKDTATNRERRQRFIKYITGYNLYPHVVDFDYGRLILLDSMQAELDENTGDIGAEGKLGDAQLYGLGSYGFPKFPGLKQHVDAYQEERKQGKKLVVSLHHSPFDTNLKDADKLLEIIYDKIDCLLFGHTTPDGVYQQPSPNDNSDSNKKINGNQMRIPLINCENLQNVEDDGTYPITVLDLGAYRRIVYKTDGSEPERSWGNLS